MESVVCFGSGTIREEYAKKYGSPFAIETALMKLRSSDLSCEVTRSLFDTIRQYRESFDVYGTKLSFEWEQLAGEKPVLYSGYEDARRVEVPDYGSRLPKEIAPYTVHGVYDEQHEHTSFIQGAGHGGSHPHLAHEFIRAIVEERESAVDAPPRGQLDHGGHLRARIGHEGRKADRRSRHEVAFHPGRTVHGTPLDSPSEGPRMITHRGVLTGGSYLSMFFLGVGTAVIGAASGSIGHTPYQTGLLISVQNVGFIVSVLASGALADSSDKARLMSAGSFLLAVSFFLYYLWPGYAVNLVIMLFIGAGIGAYEGVADAMLLGIHEKRQGLHISVNHFFVTFGALGITLYLILLKLDWRRSMVQSAALVCALAVLFLFSRAGKGGQESQSLSRRVTFPATQGVLAMLLLLATFGVGIELGLTGLLPDSSGPSGATTSSRRTSAWCSSWAGSPSAGSSSVSWPAGYACCS